MTDLKSQAKKKPLKYRCSSTFEEDRHLPFIKKVLSCLIKDTYSRCRPDNRVDQQKDLDLLHRRLSSEGIKFATTTLPKLFSQILNYLEEREYDFSGFKTSKKTNLPVFLEPIITLMVEGDIDAFECCYQLMFSFKKLKGTYKPDILVKQLKQFIETDKELGSINFDTQTVKLMAYWIQQDFGDIDSDSTDFKPRPGPGATNTPCPRNMRYEPHVRYRTHEEVFPYNGFFYINAWNVCLSARNFLSLPIKEEPTARFTFVPKTYDVARGICIEENESQVLQQGVAHIIVNRINNSYLRQYIQLDNQSLNANLALEASLSGKYATIDMSEASNRIARLLVHNSFNRTLLGDMLDALSTEFIEIPEKLFRLSGDWDDIKHPGLCGTGLRAHMFAPMGSGLCFPVQSLIHYYLIRAIIQRNIGEVTNEQTEIYVYGDDIIVPKKYIPAIFDSMPYYGMKLNKNKSFWNSKFRESCGIHAYNGMDVTPVYFKYTVSNNPGNLFSLAVNEKSLRDKGFSTTAKFIRSSLISRGLGPVPADTPFLGIFYPKEDMCMLPPFKAKYDFVEQHWNYRMPYLTPTVKSGIGKVSNDDVALFRWFNHPSSEEETFANEKVELERRDTALSCSWRWMHEVTTGVVAKR